jgi:lysozyme
MVRGIDSSRAQGPIDWAKLYASGVRFTFVKCGNGNDAPDPSFAPEANAAKAAGLVVGAYHAVFPLPTDPAHPGRDPRDQARAHFAQCVGFGSLDGELPPAMDLEWPVPGSEEWIKYGCSTSQVKRWALAYLDECEQLYGCLPVLYDGFPVFWEEINGPAEPRFARYPLWRVDYRPNPVTPKPWGDWTFWQTTGGGGRLPNGAPVDTDLFNGDEAALAAFACAGLP